MKIHGTRQMNDAGAWTMMLDPPPAPQPSPPQVSLSCRFYHLMIAVFFPAVKWKVGKL